MNITNPRGTVYLYRKYEKRERAWLYRFYQTKQHVAEKEETLELYGSWPDCNISAAFGWIKCKFGSKECNEPNRGIYRLEQTDLEMLLDLRTLPPGTTGKLK